ncbi:MAG: formate acetyltransferase [Desulfobacteraceae bacterium]|nr:MAG: formate acetyltransferase [Desulfobacteraceae bacterium]
MLFFTTDHLGRPVTEEKKPSRVMRLKNSVQTASPGICTDRACIWTAYHKQSDNRKKSAHIQMAESLREVLLNKKIRIYPDELIVGNYSSKRVGGSIFPELHGVPVLLDIFKFSKRKTNPLRISGIEIWNLLKIIPFWMFRFMALKAYRSPYQLIRLLIHQLKGHFYIINESGGISHIAPDYEKLISIGTDGILAEASGFQKNSIQGTEKWCFYEAVKIIADALAKFGQRYAHLAEKMASAESDAGRKQELFTIAQTCRNVPQKGASSFQEAVQSLFFAQIAINLESLDNSVCPGRMDQYLYPFYEADLQRKQITRDKAKELLSAFSIKMSEIIPVFSEYLTNIHGGMFNGQVVTVGGLRPDGTDGTNELTYVFLEIMDELRMRQPNYHARISDKSPEQYLEKIHTMLANGSNSPALYNDTVIVDTMVHHGYSIEDARDYTGVGCVEPVAQGKSFSSTDAALLNVPLILELALNQGRRFGSRFRSGAKSMPVKNMRSMEDVKTAFEIQLADQVSRLIKDLQAIETANRKYHPTPLTSSLLEGCLENGICSTAGGARYNFSGIQCVAPADTGDSLFAIEKAVFTDQKITLPALVKQLSLNLPDNSLRNYLKAIEKFGNDQPDADKWTVYVVEQFTRQLNQYRNTRGGRYVPGLYSVTIHEYYGRVTGALPNGRKKGESFSSGISPSNGMDRLGPTALINSVNRIDFSKIANGVNFNLKFDSHTLRGPTGKLALKSVLSTYFRKGGMQVQVNVLDPSMLLAAKNNPDLYPHLLVRVSGYSAYFNDLSPKMKDEIIRRSSIIN